ncbi:MAG: ribonuclease Z [Deltaproteobacteria bacterium]|nr:ribonuclease Z [Deltaproteobacteria bacterium]
MFTARLVNDPFADPLLYVRFGHRREAFLFDLGDLRRLTPREILAVSRIFVSHTHMDHFIGFDQFLRVCLGRNRRVSLYGPSGFIENVESKFGGYTWNLLKNYTNDFVLEIFELAETKIRFQSYGCRTAFAPGAGGEAPFNGVIVDNDRFSVRTAILDHKTPSLAFALEEKKRINIKGNVLREMGLPAGRWLSDLKTALAAGYSDDVLLTAAGKDSAGAPVERQVRLGEARNSIVQISEGRKIVYVADALYSDGNVGKIIDLAGRATELFIEAHFLEKDRDLAREKHHLTAWQAGDIARRAGAEAIKIFHFSPKYKSRGHLLEDEALAAFGDQRRST